MTLSCIVIILAAGLAVFIAAVITAALASGAY